MLEKQREVATTLLHRTVSANTECGSSLTCAFEVHSSYHDHLTHSVHLLGRYSETHAGRSGLGDLQVLFNITRSGLRCRHPFRP